MTFIRNNFLLFENCNENSAAWQGSTGHPLQVLARASPQTVRSCLWLKVSFSENLKNLTFIVA